MMENFFEAIREHRSLILKVILTLFELTFMILFIVYSILLIGAIRAQSIYSTAELGIRKDFIMGIISAVMIILGPPLIKFAIKWADDNARKMNLKDLERNFFLELLNKSSISIDELAEKYHLTNDDIRDFLFRQIQKGFIKGTIEKTAQGEEYFDILPGYEITSPEEIYEIIFNREIANFLAGYTAVPIKKIAKYFGISPEQAEIFLKKQLQAKNIAGYIDNNTFYREWPDYIEDMEKLFKKDEVKCPHCSNYTDGTKPFCAWCGNPLKKKEESENRGMMDSFSNEQPDNEINN